MIAFAVFCMAFAFATLAAIGLVIAGGIGLVAAAIRDELICPRTERIVFRVSCEILATEIAVIVPAPLSRWRAGA